MMVSCPGCNTSYSLDERKIPSRGGHLTCRECGNKWKVGGPPRNGVTATPAVPSPRTPAATERAEHTPPATTSAAPTVTPLSAHDSSASLARPVNCPKCGHFFVPSAAHPADVTSAGAQAPRARARILVVEDQNYFAELTREALGESYETTVASTLAAARSMVDSGNFDLVILDLSLEDGQDGSHVLKATRKHDIPVLIFTARDETELYGGGWDQLKAAGASDILFKGMNVGDELRKKVQALLPSPQKQSTQVS